MRIPPQTKLFDAARFKEIYDEWFRAGIDSVKVGDALRKFAEFNTPFIAHFQAMLDNPEFNHEHKRKVVQFWISALKSGMYPHYAPVTEPTDEFLQFMNQHCPYLDYQTETVPNLEKL